MKSNATPCFPQFAAKVAAMGKRAVAPLSSLIDVEAQFSRFLPKRGPEFPADGPRRRDRKYPSAIVFWSFIWQVLKPRTSCREVVRQIQATRETQNFKYDESTSGYCQARTRLPESTLRKALADTAETAAQLSHAGVPGWNRPVKVVDATSVTLPDTAANRKTYPYAPGQKPGCGFPNMKVLALSSLASGAVLAARETGKHIHDIRMFKVFFDLFKPGDIALGDRAFCAFASMATLLLGKVDSVFRLHQRRLLDKRQARRIGPSDWIATWTRPIQRPDYVEQKEWDALPEIIQVRIFRVQLKHNGFRTKTLWIATTLLDPVVYPLERIAELYRMRWDIELGFRDLKTTMAMEELRCRTPAMARKELLAYLVAHNFIRCLEAEAATRHGVPRHRISFKGTIDAARAFHAAMSRARSKGKSKELRDRLLEIIALDLLPERPGRREPRAVKRRPKPYPLLTKPRSIFREIPHRGKKSTAA